MQFLLYSSIDKASVVKLLGAPEYSYYFVLKGYQEALSELGRVTVIHDPQREVDVLYEASRKRGEPCVFLHFAPPYRALMDLKCPTVSVFAWEYSNIPNESWDDDPRSDWRNVFEKHGRTITLSTYTADAVRKVMGEDFPVAAIPVPVWDHYATSGDATKEIHYGSTLPVVGTVIDSRDYDLSTFRMVDDILSRVPAAQSADISLDGVIFTTVFCPTDGRKNWLDLVTAFCHAFQDNADATLIIKMTHHDAATFLGPMRGLFSELSPFKCRVIAMNGYLDQPGYERLMAATHYYVNASHCEGLCLPLMEFMSYGKPAIAPVHTAMRDYIDDRGAFTLRASLECNVWPQDPRDLFRTMRYRLDWESLFWAYRESHQRVREHPAEYLKMARHAREKMRSYCSRAVVKKQLAAFFGVKTDGKQGKGITE